MRPATRLATAVPWPERSLRPGGSGVQPSMAGSRVRPLATAVSTGRWALPTSMPESTMATVTPRPVASFQTEATPIWVRAGERWAT